MTAFVLDSSAVIASVLPDEAHGPAAVHIIRRVAQDGAIVPVIWPLEVVHVLLKAERQRRLTPERCRTAIGEIQALPVSIEALPDWAELEATARLARKHHMSFYDASYVRLAVVRGLPLATFDLPMRAVAEAERIPILD